MKRADAIWNKGPELIDDDGEVRELTVEDFKKSVPFSALPESLQFKLKEIQRGNATISPEPVNPEPVKKMVSIALSSDVLAKFEAKGAGWESKVDEALREWLDEHKAS